MRSGNDDILDVRVVRSELQYDRVFACDVVSGLVRTSGAEPKNSLRFHDYRASRAQFLGRACRPAGVGTRTDSARPRCAARCRHVGSRDQPSVEGLRSDPCQAEADIRTLAGIPLELQGALSAGRREPAVFDGADEPARSGQTADYIDGGSWADKAIKEAKRVGTVNVAASTKSENYSRLPKQSELKLTPGAAYVHMTSNNTIEGTEYSTLPAGG